MVQLLHPYMTTGKTISLTRWTLVGKVISLLFNMLSRLVIAFLPSFNFMAAVTIRSDFGALWQLVISKDGDHNDSHLTRSSYNSTYLTEGRLGPSS